MTDPRRGHIAAIGATLGGAIYAIAGAAFITWFYSGLAVSDVFVPWEIVLPFLAQAAIHVAVAVGLMRRWRVAFLAGLALHLLAVIRWGVLVAVGDPFVFEWVAVLPGLLAVVALLGLAIARPLFWRNARGIGT